MSSVPQAAILLIAHGSRRQSANDDLPRLAAMVRARRPESIVEIAYLELAEPTIPEGARRCVERGAAEVLMLPYFLSAGEHVAGDLDRFRSELAERYPAVAFRVCPPLGLHPLIVEIVLDRLKDVRIET